MVKNARIRKEKARKFAGFFIKCQEFLILKLWRSLLNI